MTDFDLEAATWDSNPMRIERARAVAQGIRANLNLSLEIKALEYGCGTGLLSFALQPDLGHITLADNSKGMLAVLNEKIASTGISNMTSMFVDFAAGPLSEPTTSPQLKYNLIYTLMTLHHIPDTAKILKEFYNLLDVPGYLCVADLDKEDGTFHGIDFEGHKGFDRDELGASILQAGFHSVKFETIFQSPRAVGNETKHFPLFLMIAEKR